MNHRWTVSQIGAREHYAVPRALQAAGELRTLFTDTWCRRGRKLLLRGPRALRSIATRFHPQLHPSEVESFNVSSTLFQLRRKFAVDRYATLYQEYVRYGEQFATRVTESMSRRAIDPNKDRFFGFFTGCLETLQFLREKGVFCVVDQADAAKRHYELVAIEAAKWPGWQPLPPVLPQAYFNRLTAEWARASAVLVNSQYSRESLVMQGVDDAKIIVCPLAFEPPREAILARPPEDGFTFVWLGNVSIGKGIQYVIEAAKKLEDANVRFKIAGQVVVSADAVATAPANVEFLGQISRDQIGAFLARGHVFVFPTLSDGFGLAQLEAMAHGLPVIATSNCGQVVTPETDGLIIPACDGDALAGACEWFVRHRDRWPAMSAAAVAKAGQFGLAKYRQTLLDGVARIEM